MIFKSRAPILSIPVFLWVIVLAGCAARLPLTMPVTEVRKNEILSHYLAFRARDCAIPVDADIALDAQSFGRQMKMDGYLQIQPPALVRATVLDKVGRPLFLLVAKGDTLTLVDSMKGEALIGSAGALMKSDDFPVEMRTEEVASLLTGSFSPDVLLLKDIRSDDPEARQAWLVFAAPGGNRYKILFDPPAERILRHAVEDRKGGILLDIRYEWSGESRGECLLPASLFISGKAIGGAVELKYADVMRPALIPADVFELSLPDHYRIRHAD